jgi:predicted DCC family thiol-disulfide oxidoreductase YuxK
MVNQAIVYYDGLCALCDGFVRFVLQRDRRGRFIFAPLQGRTARDRIAGRLSLETMPTVVLETDDGIRLRSDAALAILAGLGGLWKLTGLLRLVPRMLADAAYDLIARHRYRWFGRRETCRIPAAGEQHRFLP